MARPPIPHEPSLAPREAWPHLDAARIEVASSPNPAADDAARFAVASRWQPPGARQEVARASRPFVISVWRRVTPQRVETPRGPVMIDAPTNTLIVAVLRMRHQPEQQTRQAVLRLIRDGVVTFQEKLDGTDPRIRAYAAGTGWTVYRVELENRWLARQVAADTPHPQTT